MLTSMIHRASVTQDKDSGLPPGTPAPPEGEHLPTVPTECCLQLALSLSAPTSQCDVGWAALESRGKKAEDGILQEQPVDNRPDFLRMETPWRSKNEKAGEKQTPHIQFKHIFKQRNTPTSHRGLAFLGHRNTHAPCGHYGVGVDRIVAYFRRRTSGLVVAESTEAVCL